MQKFLNAAIQANKELYFYLQEYHKELFSEFDLGVGGDISSGFDLFAEKLFIKYLSPFGIIDSEECGKVGNGLREIIIDPIDGSSNIASGLPYFGTSIALKEAGKVKAAIICNLANGDLFYKMNNTALMVGKVDTNHFQEENINKYEAKVGIFEKAYAHGNLVGKINALGFKFRTPGAVALSLAYAHRVKFVLFKGRLRHYDLDAGLAMCNDLFVTMERDYLLVAKEKAVFEKIEAILKDENEIDRTF